MQMLQLSPTIPVDVKGMGSGEAYVLINYGIDLESQWIVFMDDSGDSVVVANGAIKKCS
jgi:hypothetical protein